MTVRDYTVSTAAGTGRVNHEALALPVHKGRSLRGRGAIVAPNGQRLRGARGNVRQKALIDDTGDEESVEFYREAIAEDEVVLRLPYADDLCRVDQIVCGQAMMTLIKVKPPIASVVGSVRCKNRIRSTKR